MTQFGNDDVNAAGREIKCGRQADGTGAYDEHGGSQFGQWAPSLIYRQLAISRRAGSALDDLLVQFVIHHLDRAVDLGIGHAQLM